MSGGRNMRKGILKARAAREQALTRPELRGLHESVPRQSAAGPVSAAIKREDPEQRAAIDAWLKSRGRA